MQSRFWWCLLHAFMSNRECSFFRTFSIGVVTMFVVSKTAHISNPNFIFYSDMKKFMKFAHANFLTLEFLKNAWVKINFETKFELSIKLRVEWYMAWYMACILWHEGHMRFTGVSKKCLFFTPTQFSKILKTSITR